MCLHEFVWLVAQESTQYDVGHFMSNLHSLTNFIWHFQLILRLAGAFVFFANDSSAEHVCPALLYRNG